VSLERPLRVVVADDHPYYRRGLVRSLRARGIEVVAEAPNGEAAIHAVQETAPDVVVMDLKMPGMSGLEATRRLTARAPASRVLVLSVSNDEEDVSNAVLAGACGYVLKESAVDEVVAGIRAAASGASHISQAITTPLLRRLREPARPQPDLASVHLSDHEREVLNLLARGMEDEEIAEVLGVAPESVRRDASSILTKLVHAAVRVSGGQPPST
jgi:DNA-binding NarL/FixJ family response regulator